MIRTLVAAGAALMIGAAYAQKAPEPTVTSVTASGPGQMGGARIVEVRAIVVGLDKQARIVDLKGPNGRIATIEASDEVKNFDQINLGDHVVVRYVQSITMSMAKPGTPATARTEQTEVARAPVGERPGVAVGRQIQAICVIVEVNKKTKTVTLKGPRGNYVDVVVDDAKKLGKLKKGDHVDAVYTEAVALSVEPAPPAKAKKK
ncbi:MAG: hypothetical protein ACREVQ_00620 [Burkholderiales bacterium]